MKASNLPNLISAVRMVMVIPVIWYLYHRNFQAALVLFAIAGLTDGIDGYLARRFGWMSKLGGWLDPVADKLMQVSAYIMLTWLGLIPLWILIAVILRDVVIVAGSTVYYFWVEKVSASPSLISKVNTLLQILLVVLILVHMGSFPIPPQLMDFMLYAVFITTVVSGLDYVLTWSIRAWKIKKGVPE